MKIAISKMTPWEHLADLLMVPIMYIVSGTFTESPQRTHKWNNTKKDFAFDSSLAVKVQGIEGEVQKRNLRFHLPILGGWKKYVVISPLHKNKAWYIGWKNTKTCGISKIKLSGSVRMLIGPQETEFIGFTEEGEQIPIKIIGQGRIGDGGIFSKIPLL